MKHYIFSSLCLLWCSTGLLFSMDENQKIIAKKMIMIGKDTYINNKYKSSFILKSEEKINLIDYEKVMDDEEMKNGIVCNTTETERLKYITFGKKNVYGVSLHILPKRLSIYNLKLVKEKRENDNKSLGWIYETEPKIWIEESVPDGAFSGVFAISPDENYFAYVLQEHIWDDLYKKIAQFKKMKLEDIIIKSKFLRKHSIVIYNKKNKSYDFISYPLDHKNGAPTKLEFSYSSGRLLINNNSETLVFDLKNKKLIASLDEKDLSFHPYNSSCVFNSSKIISLSAEKITHSFCRMKLLGIGTELNTLCINKEEEPFFTINDTKYYFYKDKDDKECIKNPIQATVANSSNQILVHDEDGYLYIFDTPQESE